MADIYVNGGVYDKDSKNLVLTRTAGKGPVSVDLKDLRIKPTLSWFENYD